MVNKVFISHKREDTRPAISISEQIKANGISTYVDVIDDALLNDGPELGDYIRNRMSSCDQLIAVISRTTQDSWWVPWEIGVATEKDFRIASYADSPVSLPSYLDKWPVLRNLSDVDLYCRYSKEADQATMRKMSGVYTSDHSATIRKADVGEFHKDLSRALRSARAFR